MPDPAPPRDRDRVDVLTQIYELEARSEALRDDLQHTVDDGRKLILLLQAALEESVKLQSHYARLLNAYDGGQRLTFVDADSWLARLAQTASRTRSNAFSGGDRR